MKISTPLLLPLLVAACATTEPAGLSRSSSAPARAQQVERILFELCPKVLANSVDLSDPAQLEELGLSRLEPRNGWIYAGTGIGAKQVTIGDWRLPDKRICEVGFDGSDNDIVLRSLLRAALSRGWRAGSGASELGGFISFLYPANAVDRRIMLIHSPKTRYSPQGTRAGMILDVTRPEAEAHKASPGGSPSD